EVISPNELTPLHEGTPRLTTYLFKDHVDLRPASRYCTLKSFKDRVMLLLGGNVAGFKLKPYLIYRSENPRALKQPEITRTNCNSHEIMILQWIAQVLKNIKKNICF
uniref:Uncharacterized protein n=1 Tax=Scleropages formosus TaxID=113540 RepID=A0A8C9VUS1_SCLFO